MPGKYKTHHGDEYESDDMETADTLIGRNRVTLQKKPRPSSATKKKPTKRPVTPGSARKKKRPQSAPSSRSGRELWLNAVKNRQTVGLTGSRHPGSPRHKTASEYWIDTLRKTGHGFSTESTGMNTFSGKHPNEKAMPYLSTSAYMRQLMGTEKASKNQDAMAKASPGTPAYKSQEEYYEQILEYKKQVSAMNQDASSLKAKIRRLEEDNLKKEKEIAGLLDPQKSEEVRRTLADKKPDSGAVIHSLKQKILKLETQLRDKETCYIKLQSDMKTTKVEEMKQQMEVFCQEIIRLQNSKETGMDRSARQGGKEGSMKVKALNETVIRLSKNNEQLQTENRSLKEDLRNAMDEGKDKVHSIHPTNKKRKEITQIPDLKREYEDMNRKQLLKSIAQLERKLERAERHTESGSVISYESKATDVPGKIALQGSLEERLEQLDQRESELLEKLEKNQVTIQQLRDEKARLRRRCEEFEKLLQSRHIDYDRASFVSETRSGARRSSPGSRPGSSRPLSGRSERPLSSRSEKERDRPLSGRSSSSRDRRPSSAKRKPSVDSTQSSLRRENVKKFTENHAAKNIQKHWRTHQKEKRDLETQANNLRETNAARRIQRSWRTHNEEQIMHNQKVEHFRENRAARKIQREWTGYRKRKIEDEQDEASDLIRSALLGHTNRQKQMQRYMAMQDSDEDHITDDEEYNNCVDLIQSALRGHNSRVTRMKNQRYLDSAGEDEEDDDDDIMLTPKRSLASLHKPVRPQSGKASIASSSRASLSSSHRSLGSYSRTGGRSNYDFGDDDF